MKLASQVLRLQGEVFAVDAAGRRRRLRPFDRVAADERLAFAEGAQVWLLRDDGKSVLLTGDTPPTEVSPPPGPDTRHALAEAAPAPRVKRALRLTDAPPPDGEEGHGGFSVVFLTRIQERVPNSPLWWPGADDAESVHEQALPTWAGAAEQSLMGRGFSLVEPSDGIGRRDVTNARATVQSEEEKFMRQTETANQNEPAEIEEGEFMLTEEELERAQTPAAALNQPAEIEDAAFMLTEAEYEQAQDAAPPGGAVDSRLGGSDFALLQSWLGSSANTNVMG